MKRSLVSLAMGTALILFGVLTSSLYASANLNMTPVNAAAREELVRNAEVWRPVDVKSQNIKLGPNTLGIRGGEWIECTFVEPSPEEPINGATPKFKCKTAQGVVHKVKYGRDNGEVYGEVASSRLFWALGFGADEMLSVSVNCHDCPINPWGYILENRNFGGSSSSPEPQFGTYLFSPAAVESKLKGKNLEMFDDQGWSFSELKALLSKNEATAKIQAVHRDALTLLSTFVQHIDNKVANQRMVCPKADVLDLGQGRGSCRKAVLYVQDLGATFGGDNYIKMELKTWASMPIWKDAAKCIPYIASAPHWGQTLKPVAISEAGRAFLADLMMQLSDAQIVELFRSARVHVGLETKADPQGVLKPVQPEDWAAAFKAKRAQLVSHKCPQ